jgi:DNA-binding MarR family transcriptional regulator
MQLLSDTTNEPSGQLSCAGDLLELLPGLMRFVRRQMRSRRAKGLSVPQFRTLVHLRRSPWASLSSVSEGLGSSAPTTSRIVSGLVAKGLVIRKTCQQDRRQVSLELTPRGQTVIDEAWRGTQEAVAERLSSLTAGQLTELAVALGHLAGVFPSGAHEAGNGVCNGTGSR